jgi:hypothetical protein
MFAETWFSSASRSIQIPGAEMIDSTYPLLEFGQDVVTAEQWKR